MKKSIKIVAGITAFILIGGILWFANGLLGNPISKILANSSVKKYIKENYSETDVEISRVYYSFKDGNYHVDIKSPTSQDTHFTVRISPFGKVEYDSYEDYVVKKHNTYMRINDLYNLKVKEVFEHKDFPYETDIYFGELMEMPSEDLNSKYSDCGPIYGLDISELELDKDYDINEIGKKYGHIVLYIEDKDISIEKAGKILINVKSILDKKNISFYAIDFTLEKPRDKDGNVNPNEKSIEIQQFLYDDIYEKELESRIKEACYKLQNYYKEQDKIKEQEMKEITE